MKNIANNIDYGVHVAKEAYKILEPVIRDYAGHHSANQLHHHTMKAISGYEHLKNNVLDANHHALTIGGKFGGLV